jgi:outer membrane protein assembly factor BamB
MISSLTLLMAFAAQQPGGGQYMPTWQRKFSRDGDKLIAIQDLDGDGVDDWLRGDQYDDLQFSLQGSLQAISGRTGEELWKIYGPAPGSRLGLRPIEVVDFEGDGRMEIVLPFSSTLSSQSNGTGRLLVLDSVTGQLLWQANASQNQFLFANYRLITDLDGDGLQEILASSRGQGSHTDLDRVQCYKADGSLLWQTDLEFEGRDFFAVDLDGDGDKEVLLPYSYPTSGSAVEAGELIALDGRTGQLLWQTQGSLPFEQLGWLLRLEDLDQDGAIDIVATGPQTEINGQGAVGTVARFSGLDGSEMWRFNGNLADEGLGRILEIGDLDGDGIAEIVLGRPTQNQNDGLVQVLDSGTGAVKWQSAGTPGSEVGHGQLIWIDDFQNLGRPQLLVEQRTGTGWNTKRIFSGWQLLEGANGQLIWDLPYPITAWEEPTYQMTDLNGDGIVEIVFNSPDVNGPTGVGGKAAGIVLVMDGNGQVLWTEQGQTHSQKYGTQTLLSDLNADGILDLVISSKGNGIGAANSFGMVDTREGLSGSPIWRAVGQTNLQELGASIALYDLNHDGAAEVISQSSEANGWKGDRQGELQILDGASGAQLWRREGKTRDSRFPQAVAFEADFTGDGWDEVIINGNNRLMSITGEGNFHGFLTASGTAISASAGGSIDLPLDFTPANSWREYRLVFSGHGAGLNYEFGLAIPLVLDHWLYLSEAGGLPNKNLINAEGMLDTQGKGLAQIQFSPGEIPRKMVGLSLTFVALARYPWQNWQHCSVPVSILIQP